MTLEQRRTAAGAVAGLTALVLAAPAPDVALASLTRVGPSTGTTEPLVAVVALLAWTVAGWLALLVALVLLSRVPGLLGRTAGVLSGRLAPSTVRRGVEAALGLTVVVGALSPAGALAAPVAGAAPAVVSADPQASWDLDWPSSAGAPAAGVVGPAAPSPSTATRTTSRVSTASSALPPPSQPPTVRPSSVPPPSAERGSARPARAAPAGPRSGQAPPARPSRSSPTTDAVVVRPGDTLWSLAETALRSAGTAAPTDRQVAQAWPRWWGANREAVGDDPDLLLPGTVLRPPDSPAPR